MHVGGVGLARAARWKMKMRKRIAGGYAAWFDAVAAHQQYRVR